MTGFALVHSPLVGPSTWGPVAQELRRAGHPVLVAKDPAGRPPTDWRTWTAVIAASINLTGSFVLVGHSGAGPLLPDIASRLAAAPSACLFVDAGLPATEAGTSLAPAPMLARLKGLAGSDGTLPPWSDWFGPGTMERLVPDPALRKRITSDIPRLPLAYFGDELPVASGWAGSKAGYLLFSEPYRAQAEDARSRGWPVAELSGGHLELVTRPEAVAAAVLSLCRELEVLA